MDFDRVERQLHDSEGDRRLEKRPRPSGDADFPAARRARMLEEAEDEDDSDNGSVMQDEPVPGKLPKHTGKLSVSSRDDDDDANAKDVKRGRWTRAEHEVFIEALRTHGQDWKRIRDLIPSRSIVQVRTHAQKYFIRLAKEGKPRPAPGGDVLATSGSFHDDGSHKWPGGVEPKAPASVRPPKKKTTPKAAGISRPRPSVPEDTPQLEEEEEEEAAASAESTAALEEGAERAVFEMFRAQLDTVLASPLLERLSSVHGKSSESMDASEAMVQSLLHCNVMELAERLRAEGETAGDTHRSKRSKRPTAEEHGLSPVEWGTWMDVPIGHAFVELPKPIAIAASRPQRTRTLESNKGRWSRPDRLLVDEETAALCDGALARDGELFLGLKPVQGTLFNRVTAKPKVPFPGELPTGSFLLGVEGMCVAGLSTSHVTLLVGQALRNAARNLQRAALSPELGKATHSAQGVILHFAQRPPPLAQVVETAWQCAAAQSVSRGGGAAAFGVLRDMIQLHTHWLREWRDTLDQDEDRDLEAEEGPPPPTEVCAASMSNAVATAYGVSVQRQAQAMLPPTTQVGGAALPPLTLHGLPSLHGPSGFGDPLSGGMFGSMLHRRRGSRSGSEASAIGVEDGAGLGGEHQFLPDTRAGQGQRRDSDWYGGGSFGQMGFDGLH
jgi:SHAQKYF class myb-like DNA-binding protein